MKIKSIARSYFGLCSGVVAVVIFLLLRTWPALAEVVYGKWLFPVIRHTFDFTLGNIPFPVVYLFPVLLGYVILRPFFNAKNWRQHLRYYLNFSGWMIAAFYFLWGFNYARPDLIDRKKPPTTTISEPQLLHFGAELVNSLNLVRPENMTDAEGRESEYETSIRQSVIEVLNSFGMNLNSDCRVRLLQPAGALRKFGISGIYFPFTGEALLEKAHPIPDQLFVIAHEFAHSFGVTDEGEANLVAYLACISHQDLLVQYAGKLAMWEYLSYTFRRKQIEEGTQLREYLSQAVIQDLEMLREERRKYREWIPELSNTINDAYLKAQGVEEGTDAYLSLPELYLRYR